MIEVGKISSVLKKFRNPLIAWSGGKDSLLLSEVFKKIGNFKYAVVISEALEYRMHINYMRDYARRNKINLTEIETGFDFEWLNKNPEYILPTSSKIRAKIYKIVQQDHIRRYSEKNNHDVVIFGRRTDDGNAIKSELYKLKNGVYQYFPFRNVKNDEVLNYLKNAKLSPIYEKCDGYVRGTHTINICNYYGDDPIGKRLTFVKKFEPTKYSKLMNLIKIKSINVWQK